MTVGILALVGAILFFLGLAAVQAFTDTEDKRAYRNLGIAFALVFVLFLTT